MVLPYLLTKYQRPEISPFATVHKAGGQFSAPSRGPDRDPTFVIHKIAEWKQFSYQKAYPWLQAGKTTKVI